MKKKSFIINNLIPIELLNLCGRLQYVEVTHENLRAMSPIPGT